MTELPLLPQDYYLRNFTFLLDWVVERYADLLHPEETKFVETFHSLDKDSQCLLVRLMSRKGPWFRADKLSYPEINDLPKAANSLIQHGLLGRDVTIDISSLASVLTKPELEFLFTQELRGHKSKRKEEWIELLVDAYPDSLSWNEWTAGQWGELYELQQASLINTLLLLFFGNSRQDLSEFVLQDLGLVRYESYEIDQAHRLFRSRQDIDQSHLFIRLVEAFELMDNPQDLHSLLGEIPETYANPSIERRFARLLNQIAYELERQGDTELALEIYQRHSHTPARERQVRILERRGEYQIAWQLLQDILDSPHGEDEQQVARRMAARLAKKAGAHYIHEKKCPVNERQIEIPLLMDDAGEPLRVEECARQFLETKSAPCVYVENTLLCGLFGLWLWPELFRSMEGAFANPFQFAPLDFYHEGFEIRRPGVQLLWQELESGTYRLRLQQTLLEKQGIANPLVNWQYQDESVVQLALLCIPAKHLQAIFRRMLFDLRRNTSGLPDLIQFYPEQQNYRLIEIKGPGDRIQDNQQRWMDYFQEHGIPAEVCYVQWSH